MRYIIILLLFLSITGTSQAQDANTININATAKVMVPADEIAFQINLNAEAETPQEAYDLHKEREKVLVELLKKHDIEEKNINFEPIAISRIHNAQYSSSGKDVIRTRQTVTLSLDDFHIYEEIQVTLIASQFDEFSGNFMSSETERGEEQALQQALRTAREKANTIAQETGVTISGIKNISYSYNQSGPRPLMERSAMKSSDSLMDFAQAVSISANVSVTYNFEE
ncbi:MAG: SIMPL domain-containing protein [Fodinibius sp.]|nr:SIMPL domain-containing protein [Fodinibius sp.]